MNKCPVIIHQLIKGDDDATYSVRFERLDDYIYHKVDDKDYFSNQKRLADATYIGDNLNDVRESSCSVNTNKIECSFYDVEVTTITLTLRHERMVTK